MDLKRQRKIFFKEHVPVLTTTNGHCINDPQGTVAIGEVSVAATWKADWLQEILSTASPVHNYSENPVTQQRLCYV
jgi:hypothetical protein